MKYLGDGFYAIFEFYFGDSVRVVKLVGTTLRYLLTDHPSTSSGQVKAPPSRYSMTAAARSATSVITPLPRCSFGVGQVRPDLSGTNNQTDFGYTGQRNMSSIGLMDYKARFYDPALGRFIQPDTIVSNPSNSQTWNRYGYVENNPINRNDPTGHESDPWGCNGDHTCYQQHADKPEVKCDPNDTLCLTGHERKDKNPISSLFTLDGYMQGWTTFWNAWSTEFNPNASWQMRLAGYGYATAWIALHMMGVGVIIGGVALAHTLIAGAAGVCAVQQPCAEGALRFTQKTASVNFSQAGKFAGQTIGSVSNAIRSGTIAVKDVAVNYIERDGYRLIENTRSALSLMRAGIPPSQWNLINQTGNELMESKITERLLTNGLTSAGTEFLRITGLGQAISNLH